jgi:ubiquinone/menaquinone biosynthesis C-methylase UbiE
MFNHQQRFNEWADNYDKSLLQKFLFSATHNYMLDSIIGIVDDGDLLLDVACGTGKFLKKVFYNASRYLFIHGMDYSKEMIKNANKNLEGTNIILSQGDASQIPYYANKFNVVTCSHAFHHFPFQEQSIREMNRILKKGGRLILADGCVDTWWGNILFGWIINFIEHGVSHLPMEKLNELLNKNGFEIQEQVIINPVAPTMITIARKVK